MRALITGADGMLGTWLQETFATTESSADWTVLGVSVGDFDIASRADTFDCVRRYQPDIVVHLAACAFVDECELDPEMASRINVDGSRYVAEAAEDTGAAMLHVSTDYVFDGRRCPRHGYREDASPNPVNAYGRTKLGAEQIVASSVRRYVIARTAWLYGGTLERNDPVLAALGAFKRGEPVTALSDQYGSPTFARSAAIALQEVAVRLVNGSATGIYHVVDRADEGVSWFDLARASLQLVHGDDAANSVIPIGVADSGEIAARPRRSLLDPTRCEVELARRMPYWRDSLATFCCSLAA